MASLLSKLGWPGFAADSPPREARTGKSKKSQAILKARASFPSLSLSPKKARCV